MKKILTLIAAAAMLAVSCQKETPATGNTDNTGSSTPAGKLTATFVQTKVTYAENGNDLQPAWQVGDKIIGFDDAGCTYTFTVESVSADTATLSADKEITDGAYHLIYKSGAQASDISSKSLAIDYKNQAGDNTMPAVMLADGTVTDGSCEFAFSNAGAIIGISAVKGAPSGAAISKITIEGSNLSAATVALSGSALALTAATAASDAISTATLSGITTTDANGTLSAPVFIAVPAGAKIAKVSVAAQVRAPETFKIPSTAADYVEIEALYDGEHLSTKKWAKWNVGANSQTDFGWYFAWAGTEGYVWKNDKWVSASGVDTYSYSLSSVKTAGASDYLYVKTQRFTTTGHSFDWEDCPYHTGSDKNTGWTKYMTTGSSYWSGSGDPDNKLVLDPEDDAAQANWHGTWRMPTSAEYWALYKATYWAWDATDKGYYIFKADPTHTAGTRVNSVPVDLNKATALLFFPAAGEGFDASLYYAGSYGHYWSSSLKDDDPYDAWELLFEDSNVYATINPYRYNGVPVRPLSD